MADIALFATLLGCILLEAYFYLGNTPRRHRFMGGLWLFFWLLAALSMAVAVYFDYRLGATSAFGRSGAFVTAHRGSLMFWFIAIGKLVVAVFFVLVGYALSRNNGDR